jgi:uncharacterized metal-binding protein YceD (DUF177 family)
MKALKEYVIPFVGLKEGVHDFVFEVDGKFFDSFDYSEVNQGNIHVEVSMEKQDRMLIFSFSIHGYVVVPCDRCLAEMEYPVKGNERLIVKFGQERKEETEEIIVIPETESHIDISEFIYEYIMLLLPFRRVHPEGEESCNNAVIDMLDQYAAPEEDPRWEALKELKKNIE